MKKHSVFGKILAFTIAFVVVLLIVPEIGAAGDTPSLHFHNEKKTGLFITKEIYGSVSDPVPIRQNNAKYYEENHLNRDEFRFFLWGGNDVESNAQNLKIKPNIPYTRSNQYGNYYFYPAYTFKDDTDKNVTADIIIKPESEGYSVYYYKDNVKMTATSLTEKITASNPNLSIDQRFKIDFDVSVKPSNNFRTASDGSFFLGDASEGDQIYIKDKDFPYTSFCITEDTDLLEKLSDNDLRGSNGQKVSGVYQTNIPFLKNASAKDYVPSDANQFTVHNVFAKPTDAFTVAKTVEYFGALENPMNEKFKFELLVNNQAPDELEYQILQEDTVISSGTFSAPADEDERKNPTQFLLESGQQLEVTGIMKDTPIEVRELIIENGQLLTSANYYSALERATAADQTNGQYYKYIEEKDTSGNITKAYIRWTGNFNKKISSSSATDFINIPNVMLISKNITNYTDLPNYQNYDFEFEITKADGTILNDNEQVQYYLRDGAGEFYDNNGKPFRTHGGILTLKHGQTALITHLKENQQYQIAEKRALLNDVPVTMDFMMDITKESANTRTTRNSVITDTYSMDSEDENVLYKNTYNPKSGLYITKQVVDEYDRADPNAEYEFKLVKEREEFADGETKYYYDDVPVSAAVKYSIDNTKIELSKDNTFTLKKGQTVSITGLSSGYYKVIEINPNQKKYAMDKDEDYPHLFETVVQVDTAENMKKVYYTGSEKSYETSPEGAESSVFEITNTSNRTVSFTNTTRELKYYFDIEKIMFLDQKTHGTDSDNDEHAEQRFIFKVERFNEDETQFTADKVQETFYVNMNCTGKIDYANTTLNGQSYNYQYLYTAPDKTFNSNGDEIVKSTFSDNTITKYYGVKSYTYPCAIYQGNKTVMVTKKGIYRVTEMTDWSSTDYDFWKGSNIYKGYGDGRNYESTVDTVRDSQTTGESVLPEGSKDSVFIPVSKVKAYNFEEQNWTDESHEYYRPTASFTNSESEFAYNSSQAWAENIITIP